MPDITPEDTERLNKLYHEKMTDRKAQFLHELIDPLEVVSKLENLSVPPGGGRIRKAVADKPFRQQQKAALFDVLAGMPFASIDCVTEALKRTKNSSLSGLMTLIRLQIGQECPFTDDMITRPPPPIESDGSGQGKGERSELNPSNRDSDDKLYQAALDGSAELLENLLSSTARCEKSLGTAILCAAKGKNSENAIECIRLIVDHYVQKPCALTKSEAEIKEGKTRLINHKDGEGNTAMHLAAENESVEIVRRLYENYKVEVDLLIENKVGFSPLELMCLKTPEVLVHLLNGSFTAIGHPSDGNFKFEIDLGFLIRKPPKIRHNGNFAASNNQEDPNATPPNNQQDPNVIPLNNRGDPNAPPANNQGNPNAPPPNNQEDPNAAQVMYAETDFLAYLVRESEEATKIILPHFAVKSFLDLKWECMKFWLYASMVIQISIYLCYMAFVILFFLVDCPHLGPKNQQTNTSSENHALNNTGGTTFFGYLIEWGSVDSTCVHSHAPSPWSYFLAIILITCGIVFIIKEFFELRLITQRGGCRRPKKQKESKPVHIALKYCACAWKKAKYYGKGLKTYIFTFENSFQLFFMVFMIMVCTSVFDEEVAGYKVAIAAFSIVLAGTLILMQIANVAVFGIYIQMLGKAVKTFGILMGTYIGLIIAFSISFSIIFPSLEPFHTLPKSLSRVLVMMTGELSYDERFYGDGDEHPRPPIPLVAQIIFLGFMLFLPIVLINLLIALTVSDVKILRDKAEVIRRSIQLDQLYVMESFLIEASNFINDIGNRFGMKNLCSMAKWNVVKPTEVAQKGMVVEKSIKDIKDKHLQREIRSMAMMQKNTQKST